MSDKSFANPVTDATPKAATAEVNKNETARNEAWEGMKDYTNQSKCSAPKDTLPNVILHDSSADEKVKVAPRENHNHAELNKEKTAPVKVPPNEAMNSATVVKEKPGDTPRNEVTNRATIIKEKQNSIVMPGNQPANEVIQNKNPRGYLPKN